ncbi:hypothetical protein ANN_15924 [Periplaneta americana]|uniref:Mos1 transposase HTH domain-containing protein n=1 Tax=Periplaneta americana TaxID=6978 RepID=A0ABQ8SHJ1_PERAM|nr:hypothetical protein ANN_15924 [Periplaneta americana]
MQGDTIKRQVLHRQAREIVFKVYNYFKKINEQNSAGHHGAGRNVANAQGTTAEACRVGLRTVQRIVSEGNKSFNGLREACADAALTYRTVARWVEAFREGRDAVQDNLRTGRPRVEDNTVQLLASLLDADRRWTARELAAEVGVCHKTVLHILQDILGYRKITGRWIPHEISEMPTKMSPVLTPCDFYLWGYTKDRTSVPPLPQTLIQLWERIKNKVPE